MYFSHLNLSEDYMILIFIGSLQSAEDMKKCLVEKFAKESLKLTFRHISLKECRKGG